MDEYPVLLGGAEIPKIRTNPNRGKIVRVNLPVNSPWLKSAPLLKSFDAENVSS